MFHHQPSHTLIAKSEAGCSTATTRLGGTLSKAPFVKRQANKDSASYSDSERKEWVDRIRTYYGQALILFNIYGIPLSFGPYLEFYYTTLFADLRLSQLALIIAAQILCIFIMAFPVGWLYQRGWGSTTILIATVAALSAQVLLMFAEEWWEVLLLQGALMGVALGTLLVVGTLCLGSHYQYNLPLVSMESVSAGFMGAMAYTAIARSTLQSGNLSKASRANAGITSGTLLVAWCLIKRSERFTLNVESPKKPLLIFKESGTVMFAIGYMLLFSGLFIWPTYMVLFLSNYPFLIWPEVLALFQLSMFGCAIITAAYAAHDYSRRHLGPVNAFILASIVASASIINPAWMPCPWTALAGCLANGFALGAILALHLKVTTVFHSGKFPFHADMTVRTAFMMIFAGLSAFSGIVAVAMIAEFGDGGFVWALTIPSCVMLLGSVLMSAARWRRCKQFFVAM